MSAVLLGSQKSCVDRRLAAEERDSMFFIDPKAAHDSRPKVSFRGTVIAGVYCVCARLAQKYVFVIAVLFFLKLA